MPPLEGLASDGKPVPGLDPAAFKGKISVVNVWASWCVPCHDEAPLLTELGKDKRLQVIGINYKDSPENARRFLGRYGNPFGMIGVDGNGRAAIEWGVYGVPETFIVGRDGKIAYKLVGPITPDNLDQRAEGRDRQGVAGAGLLVVVIARSDSDEQSTYPLAAPWIVSRSLSSGAHSRNPLARNDGYFLTSPSVASLASSDTGSSDGG